jgi:hypothetical protein
MLTAFYDEEVVTLGEDTLRLACDFRAIDLMEHTIGNSDAITPATEIVRYMLGGGEIPISISCKVLYALLQRHHEGVSYDVCMGVIGGEHSTRVALAVQTLLKRSFGYGEAVKAKAKNPRARRGASKTS